MTGWGALGFALIIVAIIIWIIVGIMLIIYLNRKNSAR
jgi:tellurite resistance protein TehA-like permease